MTMRFGTCALSTEKAVTRVAMNRTVLNLMGQQYHDKEYPTIRLATSIIAIIRKQGLAYAGRELQYKAIYFIWLLQGRQYL